jgi:hypothetical protein
MDWLHHFPIRAIPTGPLPVTKQRTSDIVSRSTSATLSSFVMPIR